MFMKYRIGLDIGITSVGWSVLEHDINENPCRIVDFGVRIFDAAENPKDGSSPCVDRRNARGRRRLLRRKQQRLTALKSFMTKNLLAGNDIKFEGDDVYSLRLKALDEEISKNDIARIIYSIAKHRGFKSNKISDDDLKAKEKSANSNDENQKAKQCALNNSNLLKSEIDGIHYRTIGEMLCKNKKYFEVKTKVVNDENVEYIVRNIRNKSGAYDNTMLRQDLLNEIELILHSQQKYHEELTQDFIEQICSLVARQRSFDDGPSKPSKYNVDFEELVNNCVFIPDEKCAPKASFSYEYFVALQDINNLKINNTELTEAQKEKLKNLFLQKKESTFKDIRKVLELNDEDEISGKGGVDKKENNFAKNLLGTDLIKINDIAKIKYSNADDELIGFKDEQQIHIKETLKGKKEFSCDELKDCLNLPNTCTVRLYSKTAKKERIVFKRPFSYELLKKLGYEQQPLKYWDLIDTIAYLNSKYKSDENRTSAYNKDETINALSEEEKQILLTMECSGYGNLSKKALKMLIPHFKNGLKYTEACKQAGFSLPEFEKKKKLSYKELAEIEDVASPVVKRAISQTIKVVNAIITKYGSPVAIFMELSRDMGRNFSDRNKLRKENEENQESNERIKRKLSEFGILSPRPNDIVKYKLYEEQGGKCAYSGVSLLDKFGSMAGIFNDNNTQIDHIVPYSKCYDDSYNNKVLVLSSENANKGNRLPFEYFGNDQQKWTRYEEFCQTFYSSNRKKLSNLLKKAVSDEEEQQLNNRAMNDTKYVAVFMKDLFVKHLLFEQSKKFEKKPVRTINGRMTSFLRKIWGLPKHRFLDDKHHAVDAAIIACTDDGMVKRVTIFMQKHDEEKYNRGFVSRYGSKDESDKLAIKYEEVMNLYGNDFQMPYPSFKQELELRICENVLDYKDEFVKLGYDGEEISQIKPLLVSRMVNHKVLGKIHDDTIRSKKLMDKDSDKLIVVTKTKIQNLKLNSNNEIADYPEKFKESDPVLYKALRNRLLEFNGDGQKAFAEPFYKPTKTGLNQNLVKTVKLQKTVNDGIEINKGFAENASMIRVDIFEKNNKNYAIPVYVADAYRQKLPNKLAKAGKPYKDWPELDDSYKFKFSLFKNDLIKVKNGDGINFTPCDKNAEKKVCVMDDLYVYYNSFNRAVASIRIETIDGRYFSAGIGIQNLECLEKFKIDILGNIQKVTGEKRQDFKLKH